MPKTDPNPPAEDEVDVVLDPSEGADLKVAPDPDAIPAPSEPPPAALPPEDGIEALKAYLEREKSGRLAAEAQAREAIARANSAGKETQDANLTLLTNAITQLNTDSDRLEGDYAAAMTDGDYAAAAKIQRKMAANAANLQALESGKVQLEQEAKRPPPEPARIDPVEALASQLSPRSAAWVRSHPEFATDPRLYQKMLAAHNLATADGLSVDTDDYFDAVEDTLRLRRRPEPEQERDTPLSSASETVARRQSPPAAPVSRQGSNGATPARGTIRLSAAEREIAQMNGMSDLEYATQKAALIAEGKMN